MDESFNLTVTFIGFNARRPPFDNAMVRHALASAIDRGPILEMARRYGWEDVELATTLTPPGTLGRDLYGEVGISFDPLAAKDLLTQAGYEDPSTFPPVVFLVGAYGGAPGVRYNMANEMADMWETHLGIAVDVQVVSTFQEYYDRLDTNPPELFWFTWAADYNDPDNFLRELFHSGSEHNSSGFSNEDFDSLVERARTMSDPAERQELYIQAERLLCEAQAALIAIFH
jgi:ABC-type transport system substrate-binding protein